LSNQNKKSLISLFMEVITAFCVEHSTTV